MKMATTKIWPVRDNLARVLDYADNHVKTANPDLYSAKELKDLREVLDYAANDEKTAKQYFVTGVNCIGEIAYEQMTATKQRFGKADGYLAYHAYQSFSPEEVTPERCHEIGLKLAERIWGDRHEVLVTTHMNTHCVHNHFVVNSVSCVDGYKLDSGYGLYFNQLRKESDRICAEYGLSVIEKPKTPKNKFMAAAEKRGEPTLWSMIRSDIDETVWLSMTEKQFYRQMKDWGYTFGLNENRKHPRIFPPGSKKATRLDSLGDDYIPDRIARRIYDHGFPKRVPRTPQTKVQHYRFHGSFRNMRSVSGLYITFLLLTLILRKIINYNRRPNNPHSVRYTPELRAAIRQMEKYSAETRLMCCNKIETSEQLKAFIDVKNQERSSLERERCKVYNQRKSAKTPEHKEALTEQRNKLSAEIKTIRRELFYACDIDKRHEEILHMIQAQREYQRAQLGLDKPQQNKNKERGHSR